MDPPTVPGRSGLLYIGYPEEGGADIPPREPPITAQQGLKTQGTLCAAEGTDTRRTPYNRETNRECFEADTRPKEAQQIRNPSDHGVHKKKRPKGPDGAYTQTLSRNSNPSRKAAIETPP